MITHDITRLIVLLCIRRKFRHLDKISTPGTDTSGLCSFPAYLFYLAVRLKSQSLVRSYPPARERPGRGDVSRLGEAAHCLLILIEKIEMMKVILASGSPRRRELMEMLGVACEVRPSGAEEIVTSAEPEKVVEELSRLKCLDVAEGTEGDSVVIGADTVVAFEGEILGKPKGIEHARKMMRELQGKVHQVYTGVTIAVKDRDSEGYLALEREGEAPVWSDKAGGYGIETAFGTKFVKGIRGDYYNVMGLPASRVYHELKKLGVLK